MRLVSNLIILFKKYIIRSEKFRRDEVHHQSVKSINRSNTIIRSEQLSTEDINWMVLFKKYIMSPEDFWGDEAHRQSVKLINRLNAIKSSEHLITEDIIEKVCELVVLRERRRKQTIYIPNIGSSGSHWLQAMMTECKGVFGVGEVYFPPALFKASLLFSDEEKRKLIDAIHVLHTGCLDPKLVDGYIINTAHTASQNKFLKIDSKTYRILLVRNPMKICESRTFRKNEYKNYLHYSIDDDTYLNENIIKINSFFKKALSSKYNKIVKYEELIDDALPILKDIRDFLHLTENNDELKKIIEQKNKDNLKGKRNTNLYTGPKTEIDSSYIEKMKLELKDLCEKLNYSN